MYGFKAWKISAFWEVHSVCLKRVKNQHSLALYFLILSALCIFLKLVKKEATGKRVVFDP